MADNKGNDPSSSAWAKWVVDHSEIIGGGIAIAFVIVLIYNFIR